MSIVCLRSSLWRAALLGLGAALCVVLCLPARPALAATTYVVDSQADSPKLLGSGAACQALVAPNPCTLRAAIDTANTVGTQGVTVQVPGNFVILLRSIYGALHPQVSTTITSTGGGRATVDGQNQVGLMSVDSTNTVTLTNLILQHGRRGAASGGAVSLGGTLITNDVSFIGNQAAFDGGAIYDIDGTLTMNRGSFSQNTAQFGGAVYVASGGTMTANGTVFSGNSANNGGAMEILGHATLNGVAVTGNQAASIGGGVMELATGIGGPAQLDVSNSTFSGNSSANGGGAILDDQSNLTLRGSTLSGNQGTTTGGGLLVALGNAALTNDTISGNSADSGGGINQFAGTAITRPSAAPSAAVRSLLDKLSAARAAASDEARSSSGEPAGAHKSTAPRRSQPDAVSLESVTIANNSAAVGGGVWNTVGSFTAHDSILANNSATAPSSPDCFGTVSSGGYNLEGGTDCAFTATGDKQNSAPGLAPLASNGGPTQTLALQAGSPAIDAGDPGACPPPAADQRGVSRPQGPRCDIGAFEVIVPAAPVPAPPVTGRLPRPAAAWMALLALGLLLPIAADAVRSARGSGRRHV